MSYSAMMAHVYSDQDVTGWYMSRKYKGWRAIWNGGVLQTLGRYSGPKVIMPPYFWRLPTGIPLDGELWHESDDESFVKSVCGQKAKNSANDSRWSKIKFIVCTYKPYSAYGVDLEAVTKLGYSIEFYKNKTWLERNLQLENTLINPQFQKEFSNIRLANQTKIKNIQHFRDYQDRAKEIGWEGLMVVRPDSVYINDRSHSLLKVKPFYDAEAVVIGYTAGEGKHSGRIGALICRLVWDSKILGFKGGKEEMINQEVTFKVGGGMTDIERENPPKLASTIRFTFLSIGSNGAPQSANLKEIL